MDPLLQKALAAARAGHDGLLAGFGVERMVQHGKNVPPGMSREWDDRLSVNGLGQAAYTTIRSLNDTSGEAIGTFTGGLDKKQLADLVGLLDHVGLCEVAPFRSEPEDMRIRITMILGGFSIVRNIGFREPDRLAPLQPLLEYFQQLERYLRQSPQRTLMLEMDLERSFDRGLQRIPVLLRFRNQGTQPYWVAHPRTLNRGSYFERCAVAYGFKHPVTPGYPAPPVDIVEAPLLPDTDSGVQMVWMPPGSYQESYLYADVNFYRPGEFVLRAVFSTYDGEDLIGGLPRVRGCAFSPEVSVQAL